MGEVIEVTDHRGQWVRVGDMVRVLAVNPDTPLDDDEREMIEYMVGSICEVERIDPAGRAWVTMWWSCGDGTAATSIGLVAGEMEKVATPPIRSH
ncbi:MAG: hypothetical protein JNJ44_08465 [Zoogloeaceae bacterium]|nr:hypothetical protein [Zoogloeaceae bacterium]